MHRGGEGETQGKYVNARRNGQRAIVVGAGFGGIAAALRLRARGYEVTILDRASRLGGRAQVFEREGFRHDAGPTVITAPFLFDELFSLFEAGKLRAPVDRSLPLSKFADALRRVERREVIGKIVLLPE